MTAYGSVSIPIATNDLNVLNIANKIVALFTFVGANSLNLI